MKEQNPFLVRISENRLKLLMEKFNLVREMLSSLSLPPAEDLQFTDVLNIYKAMRPILPNPIANLPKKTKKLTDLLEEADAFLLDGFGVINIGNSPIDGVETFLEEAKKRKKIVVVLSNAASHPSIISAHKYKEWGLEIPENNVITSRDAFMKAARRTLKSEPFLTVSGQTTPLKFKNEVYFSEDSGFSGEIQNCVLLGVSGWNEAKQSTLENMFNQKKGSLFVVNPDVSGPYPSHFSAEPGYWAARAIKATGVQTRWFGKPFSPVFELAMSRIRELAQCSISKNRVIMVGDTPHTDILGGQAFGLKTALVTSYGFMRAQNTEIVLNDIGIYPNWIVSEI